MAKPASSRRSATGRGRPKALLREQNIRSVRHRYDPEIADERIAPGAASFDAGPEDARLHSSLVILKACSCYDYQASETEDYPSTWASAAVGRIRRAACGELLHHLFTVAPDLPGWPSLTDEQPRLSPRLVTSSWLEDFRSKSLEDEVEGAGAGALAAR